MKTNVKLIKIDGVEIPKFDEPKGEAYEKAMNEITKKVNAKIKIKGESELARTTLKGEINKINNSLIMLDDEDEEEKATLIASRKEIQDKLLELVDYSGLDIKAYTKKLIDASDIKKLKEEATAELIAILEKTRAYDKAVSELYRSITEITRTFLNDTGRASGSATRRTNSEFERYTNS